MVSLLPLISTLVIENSLAKEVKILAFGDSLTAGYQLALSEAYPARLEQLLRDKKYAVKMTNAGVSGDTSGQALRRVDWVLKSDHFDIVLLCLGANDGLRLLPVDEMERNLLESIQKFEQAKVKVVLIGMKVPTNTDPRYQKEFEAVFPRIAKTKKLSFVPFLLEGIATTELLHLEDQIHPNAKGQVIMAQTVLKTLEPLVAKLSKK